MTQTIDFIFSLQQQYINNVYFVILGGVVTVFVLTYRLFTFLVENGFNREQSLDTIISAFIFVSFPLYLYNPHFNSEYYDIFFKNFYFYIFFVMLILFLFYKSKVNSWSFYKLLMYTLLRTQKTRRQKIDYEDRKNQRKLL